MRFAPFIFVLCSTLVSFAADAAAQNFPRGRLVGAPECFDAIVECDGELNVVSGCQEEVTLIDWPLDSCPDGTCTKTVELGGMEKGAVMEGDPPLVLSYEGESYNLPIAFDPECGEVFLCSVSTPPALVTTNRSDSRRPSKGMPWEPVLMAAGVLAAGLVLRRRHKA